MLHSIAFVSMFVIGGLSGIYMANSPVDIHIHDTYYIVAHIHYVVFGGSIFALFGAIFYWFPKMFGRHMNDILGKVHFWISFLAFNGVFFPMHILGVAGLRRRIHNPLDTDMAHLQGINEFITICAFILGTAQIILLVNVFWSMFKGRAAEQNPWHANTLEWQAPTPVPHGNFDQIPHVYHGPYEYSVPGADTDWIPQTQTDGEPSDGEPVPAGATAD
jgi:cytochrome c oxidase subunit 1